MIFTSCTGHFQRGFVKTAKHLKIIKTLPQTKRELFFWLEDRRIYKTGAGDVLLTLQIGALPVCGHGSPCAHMSPPHTGCRLRKFFFFYKASLRWKQEAVQVKLYSDFFLSRFGVQRGIKGEVLNSDTLIRLFEIPETHTSSIFACSSGYSVSLKPKVLI